MNITSKNTQELRCRILNWRLQDRSRRVTRRRSRRCRRGWSIRWSSPRTAPPSRRSPRRRRRRTLLPSSLFLSLSPSLSFRDRDSESHSSSSPPQEISQQLQICLYTHDNSESLKKERKKATAIRRVQRERECSASQQNQLFKKDTSRLGLFSPKKITTAAAASISSD